MGRRIRVVLAIVMVIAGCLALPLAVTAHWLDETVTERDGFVGTFAPLATDDKVQELAAGQITEQVMSVVDDAPVPGVLSDGVESQVEDAAEKVVESEPFAAGWRDALEELHPDLVAALNGRDQDSLLTDENGEVRLVLDTLTETVKEAMGEAGIPGASLLPDIAVDIPIGTKANIETAGQAYGALAGRGTVLSWLVVVLFVAGVAIAPGVGTRAFLALGAALVAVVVLALARGAAGRGEDLAIDRVPANARSSGESAVKLMSDPLHAALADLMQIAGCVAVIAAVASAIWWFARKQRAIDARLPH